MKYLNYILPLLFLLHLPAAEIYAQQKLVEYTTIPGAEQSKAYTLTANGKNIFVEKFKDVSYAKFAFSCEAKLTVTVSQSFGQFTISPLSYRINSQKTGNSLAFNLDKPRKLIIQIEGLEEKLFIFADAPEINPPKPGDKNVTNLADFVTDNVGNTLQTDKIQKAIDQVSKKGGGVLFVPNGKYLTGTLAMKKDVTLYLESGAIIQGSGNLSDYNDNGVNKSGKVNPGKGALIYFNKADNARIMGRGVLAMAGTKIKTETNQKIRICNMVDCNNSGIYDVIIRDSGGFNIHILHSTNIIMQGYKIINDLNLPNEDGTDPDGSNGVVVDDVFMYTSDDAIAIKADYTLCENVIVKNCVFWTKKSALKIGSDPYNGARNIVFQNNDVVHADRALAIYTGKGIVENVKFLDNKSEFVGGDAKQQLIIFQVSRDKEHDPDPNRRGVGYIKDVEVVNYTAYQQSRNKNLITGTVAKDGTVHKISNVLFRNLVIEGKHCLSAEDANITVSSRVSQRNPNDRDNTPLTQLPENTNTVENLRFE
ncbi:MAG TPA: glycosyl hydrolase family 28 protein [Bacteroidales bacterium]